MKRRDTRILIVAEDGPETAELIANLVMNLDAEMSHVGSLEDARSILAEGDFDVIVAAQCLADGTGMDLVNPEADRCVPVVLLEDEPAPDRLISALRRGAADVLTTPLDYDYLIETLRRAVRQGRNGRQDAVRVQRLRRLSSRLVKDRRELRKRVDLICNDIVSAYQRLAEKVVAVMEPGDSDESSSDAFPVRSGD